MMMLEGISFRLLLRVAFKPDENEDINAKKSPSYTLSYCPVPSSCACKVIAMTQPKQMSIAKISIGIIDSPLRKNAMIEIQKGEVLVHVMISEIGAYTAAIKMRQKLSCPAMMRPSK